MHSIFSEIKEAKRLEQITSVLLKHQLGYLLKELKLKKISTIKSKPLSPKVMTKICQELGGTFVKFGQFLSIRPDLIPEEFCEALASLQDKVSPIESKVATQIAHKEIGKSFVHVDKKPLAAASIGQVHRALLPSGSHVAIKIMRPNIKEIMMTDTLILYHLAGLINKYLKQTVIDPLVIVDEFRKYTEIETNYLGEMQSLQRAAKNFGQIQHIVIPQVYKELCSEHVLTMQFIQGTPLNRALKKLSAAKKNHLAKQITHIVLKQIFIDGFFHADLHPGNILLIKQNKIGLLDWGIVGSLDKKTKELLIILMLSLINKDIDGTVAVMGDLGFYEELIDEDAFKADLSLTLSPYYDANLDQVDIAQIFLSCLQVARTHKLTVPTNLVLLGKTIITLKGLLTQLNPKFDLLQVVKPFMGEIIRKETSIHNMLKKAGSRGVEFSHFLTQVPLMTKEYFKTTKQIETDLKNLTSEVKLLSRTFSIITQQFILVLFIITFCTITVIAWDKGPQLANVSVISIISIIMIIIFINKMIKIKTLTV